MPGIKARSGQRRKGVSVRGSVSVSRRAKNKAADEKWEREQRDYQRLIGEPMSGVQWPQYGD
jgi:hypothetical protein